MKRNPITRHLRLLSNVCKQQKGFVKENTQARSGIEKSLGNLFASLWILLRIQSREVRNLCLHTLPHLAANNPPLASVHSSDILAYSFLLNLKTLKDCKGGLGRSQFLKLYVRLFSTLRTFLEGVVYPLLYFLIMFV